LLVVVTWTVQAAVALPASVAQEVGAADFAASEQNKHLVHSHLTKIYTCPYIPYHANVHYIT
jgi:hypothetical protein